MAIIMSIFLALLAALLSASSPSVATAEPFATKGADLRLHLNVILRLIYRQRPQHHHLRNAQRGFAVRGIECGGEVVEHFGGGTQRLTGIGQ